MSTTIDLPHAKAHIDSRGVATLTITEAGSLNILSSPVIADMTEVLIQLAPLPELRVLILRGTGDKAFIAGADIGEMATLNQESGERFITRLRNLCEGVRCFPVPVIARIPGWCLGGGLEFAMACDIRIAAEGTQLGMPEVKVGIPSVIHAALMPRLIGSARAAWLMLSGELIPANQAKDWGLLNDVFPLDTLDQDIDKIAASFAKLGPVVLRQQKTLLRRWEALSLSDAIEDSISEFGSAFGTGEPQQFMNEFLDSKKKAKQSPT